MEIEYMMVLVIIVMFEIWFRNVLFGCMYVCMWCFSVLVGICIMEDVRVLIEVDVIWIILGGRYFFRFCFDVVGYKIKDDLKFNDIICRCFECNLGYVDDWY